MGIVEKLKNILTNEKSFEVLPPKEQELIFLSNRENSYTLYFQNSDNKYILVGDVNYPYSQGDLDKEWIAMNKHNFEVYEVFSDLSELLERNKEIEECFVEKSIQETNSFLDEYKEKQAENLPKGWKWGIYNDGSGSLISPTKNEYFCFDWQTREYQLTPNADYEKVLLYDLSGNKQTFDTFKRYAERYAKENLILLKENQPETIQSKIEKAKEKAKEQNLNSRSRDPLYAERNDTTL